MPFAAGTQISHIILFRANCTPATFISSIKLNPKRSSPTERNFVNTRIVVYRMTSSHWYYSVNCVTSLLANPVVVESLKISETIENLLVLTPRQLLDTPKRSDQVA